MKLNYHNLAIYTGDNELSHTKSCIFISNETKFNVN